MSLCNKHETCVDDALMKADLICKDKGLRFTEIRRTILEMIWASHKPVKAYDLLDKLQKYMFSARPTTVYRSLDFLLENGLIHKLNSLNAYIGCTHPLKHHDCYFLICSNCGEIEEYCDSNISDTIKINLDKNDFIPKKTSLEIEGTCNNCLKN
ncbi:MAG: Fur family transcriptional regulator [Pseudomonadota bacterium]|nr:Fur family transcriptional regulator [Pseudomonadota bacterium]